MSFLNKLCTMFGVSTSRRARGPAGINSAEAASPNKPVTGSNLDEMIKGAQLLPEPVFRKGGYLGEFSISMFRHQLIGMKREDLAEQARSSNSDGRTATVRAGTMGFWAFDLELPDATGVAVRNEFVSRTKDVVRKPPASIAAFTAEQRIVAKGVTRIQIEEGPALPGQFEICRLKAIGWYLAEIVLPK